MSGRTLRIGIDAHAIGKRQTGNERFTANMIRSLREICEHELVLFFAEADAAAAWPRHPKTTIRLLHPDHPAARVLWQFPYASRRERLDVLLVQYVGPPFAACPIVTVVHDVAFAVYPQAYSRMERLWMPRAIPATMRRAAGIVTVSEFSRSEMHRLYGIPASKVTIATDAVDPVFTDPTPRPSRVEPPFFLTIGNLQPRKNLVTLIRAYRDLERRDTRIAERLVIVGQEFYAANTVLQEAEDLTRSGRIVFTGYLPDEDLVGLLRHATAFAYPSVYEGFGLPVVEAMASGLATAVSDVPVMREVAADAALRLPPTDPAAWADGLARLSVDPAFREDLASKGAERVKRFTWESCAAAVLDALERTASSSA